MKAELIPPVLGTDLDVVDAARVSFNKTSDWGFPCEYSEDIKAAPCEDCTCSGRQEGLLSTRDQKLIRYLAAHGHWSPFAHCYAKFRCVAPIFVARQLGKHQVGLAWNEVSRRYVDVGVDIWTPGDKWRKQSEDKKQGSSDDLVQTMRLKTAEGTSGFLPVEKYYKDSVALAVDTYFSMLSAGVCEEQARAVLPQGAHTEWIWSGSLYAFSRVANQRLSPDAQKETAELVQQISEALEHHFPVSWVALTK